MEKEFRITIDAPREKVWAALWTDATYRQWTAPFGEGSRVKTDWKKGSKVLFLGNEDSGMVSTITDNRPNEYMSFQHQGIINKGVEDLDSEEAKKWATASEDYTLRTINQRTELIVHLRGDIPQDFVDYFMNAWPKALEKLKEIAEKN
ncbi:MAG: SRPBCC domain-containing protein [Chitinophagaceae bacterium]|nr:SRPBCC domain-containing protein [Chitinophagaceae bacterium]